MDLALMNGLNMSIRLRRTPYTDRIEKLGVSGFSIVNHMLLPKAFQSTLEEDYWHLRKHVQIWDVSCQRQVEIQGPDAQRLIQLMTPRMALFDSKQELISFKDQNNSKLKREKPIMVVMK